MNRIGERFLGQWAQTRLAHQAVMLDDAAKVLSEARAATKAHRDKVAGSPSQPEDDTVIHIGDQVNVDQRPASRGLSLLAAGLLAATSGGAGAGLAAVLLNRATPPAAGIPGPQDFRVEFMVDEGKVKTEVTPLPSPMK